MVSPLPEVAVLADAVILEEVKSITLHEAGSGLLTLLGLID